MSRPLSLISGFVFAAALSSQKLEVLGAPQLEEVQSSRTAGSCFQYTRTGDRYVKCNDKEVTICDADGEGSPLLFAVDSPVTMLHFSPSGQSCPSTMEGRSGFHDALLAQHVSEESSVSK
jgi:hypothetical protein